MIVYHGTKSQYLGEIYCPYIISLTKKGKTLTEALALAEVLYEDFDEEADEFMFQHAIDAAQATSLRSPFISTTPQRHVARSFALSNDTKGFIYTIEAPDEYFFDFNKRREERNLPFHKTFGWMNEMGIPIQVKFPFEIIMIQEVTEVKEISTIIFEKK